MRKEINVQKIPELKISNINYLRLTALILKDLDITTNFCDSKEKWFITFNTRTSQYFLSRVVFSQIGSSFS